MTQVYRPAPTLWVADISDLPPGTKVRYLVDPQAQLIYEAVSDGKTLLAYEATLENLSASARGRIFVGAALTVVGLCGLGFATWRRSRHGWRA